MTEPTIIPQAPANKARCRPVRPCRVKIGALATAAILLCAAIAWRQISIPEFSDPYAAMLFDRSGVLLSASVAADGQWRFPPSGTLPPKFVHAIVSSEDRRFFLHPGIDPIAIVRALWQNLRAGRTVSGASTLTMQVARLSRPPGPRTLRNKLLEAAMSLKMEAVTQKEDILKVYAANAPFGGNVVGLEAAAWRYFGRSPARLSWAEAATLAVLPNQPALIHPGRNRRLLQAKRDRLLDRLHADGRFDALTCHLGKAEPLPPGPTPFPRLAPHLLESLRTGQISPGSNPEAESEMTSPRFKTTLDGGLQRQAAAVINRHHRMLAQNGIHNMAALILNSQTGQVLAYVGNVADNGGTAMAHGNQVDVIVAPRSTGSILKPFLYAALLDTGEMLPRQLVADIPTRIAGFMPQNYTRTYQGAVPAAMALSRSLNVPAVRMLRQFGVDRFQRQLNRLGMTTLNRPAGDYGLSLILGGAEGRLWDITGMYAGLVRIAGDGLFGRPAFFPPIVLGTLDDGTTAPGSTPLSVTGNRPPLEAAACWLTLQAMIAVTRPEADGQWRSFSSSRPVAWKTGTSYGFRDGWAVGVTPAYAVGVWAGNADGEGRPGLTGLTAAAPVMFDLFGLVSDSPRWVRPAEMVEIDVCAKSGHRAGPACADRRSEWVPLQGRRAAACPYCRVITVDTARRWQVHARCEPMSNIQQISRFSLPPAMAWFYRQGRPDYNPPPYRPDCFSMMGEPGEALMSLVSPGSNGIIYIPVELDSRRGRVVFEAAHRHPGTTIFWHLDGTYMGMTRDIHHMSLAPSPGDHRITLVDADGASIQQTFTVLADQRDELAH
ncbi:Multimodular transpeptidase-transglycosylase (EC (EC [Olavius algarvensis associated proteobacterium Delta 3]|nr:Multimodular transpeptidase-transglycosylase (EC (EC [Olavius algarvensis associated proteobacterium Delta 3]